MARRYLSMSTSEWDNLAWWERRTYLEGFEAEELITRGSSSPSPRPSGSSDTYESPPPDLASLPVGGFAALGYSELTVGPDGVVQRVGRPGA